jgi:hypothetical protein
MEPFLLVGLKQHGATLQDSFLYYFLEAFVCARFFILIVVNKDLLLLAVPMKLGSIGVREHLFDYPHSPLQLT